MDSVVALAIRRAAGLSDSVAISEDMNLTRDLGTDSFQLMAILVGIETDYGFQFRPESVVQFKTVGDIVDEVERLRARQRDDESS